MTSLKLVAVAALALGACSSSAQDGPADAGAQADATGADATDAAAADAGATDAGATCEGACRTTALVAAIGGTERALDRAQFGTEAGDGGGLVLHVEAHAGGSPECPTEASPSPDRTLVVSGAPLDPGGAVTEADGVGAGYLDFVGDQLAGKPITRAERVRVSGLVHDDAATPAWVAFDVTATFPEGTVEGHVFAERCASLSE